MRSIIEGFYRIGEGLALIFSFGRTNRVETFNRTNGIKEDKEKIREDWERIKEDFKNVI